MVKGKKVVYGKEGEWEVLTFVESEFGNPFEDDILDYGNEGYFEVLTLEESEFDNQFDNQFGDKINDRYSMLRKIAPLILGVVLVGILKVTKKGIST